MPTEPKTLLQIRKQVTSRIRFGVGHNHAMLIIQK